MKNITFSLSALLLACAALIFASCSGSDDSATAESTSPVLDGYLEVSAALFNDDLARAKAAAAKIAEDGESSLAEPASGIAAAPSLQDARAKFVLLSKEAVSLAEGQDGLHVASCPMVKDGLWVQRDTSIKNPYMGQKMPGCGTLKK